MPRHRRARALSLLLVLPPLAGCGPTEVLVGDAPGVARVVAGVLTVRPDSVPPPGAAIATPLAFPGGVAVAEDGTFYFTDRALRRVGSVSPEGDLTWRIGAGPDCGAPFAGRGDPDRDCLGDPVAIALTPDGSLIIADQLGRRVYRYDPIADSTRVVLGNGNAERAVDGAVATSSPVDGPYGLAIAADGTVYVTERFGHRVLRIDLDGRVRVVAGSGTAGDGGDGAVALDARLLQPEGVALAGDTIYIADSGNHRIRRVIAGNIQTYAGIGAAGFRGDGAGVDQALFRQPSGLARIGSLLFIVDRGNARIRLIRTGPDSITTWGGTGSLASGPDLLDIGRTGLGGPQGIAVLGRTVLIADSSGAVIRRVIR